jgi:hypothetical protein
VATEVFPIARAPSSQYLDATDGEMIPFDPPVTCSDEVQSPAAGGREPILANFRVLARTNALLRTVIPDQD